MLCMHPLVRYRIHWLGCESLTNLCYISHLLTQWLQRQAVWWQTHYASWHAPHNSPCSAHYAHSCPEFNVLCSPYVTAK